MKYEIKPSIKLISTVFKEIRTVGDTSLLFYILYEIYGYTQLEINKANLYSKGKISSGIKEGYVAIRNPIKKLHCDIYLEKINEKFQIYLGSINKEMLSLCEISSNNRPQ